MHIAMLLIALTAIKHGKPEQNKSNNKTNIKITRKQENINLATPQGRRGKVGH
jgi:transposase-like protein